MTEPIDIEALKRCLMHMGLGPCTNAADAISQLQAEVKRLNAIIADSSIISKFAEERMGNSLLAADIRQLNAENAALRAENEQLGEFVIACGGFWGNTKSVLKGPESLHACIERAFADSQKLEKVLAENEGLRKCRDMPKTNKEEAEG